MEYENIGFYEDIKPVDVEIASYEKPVEAVDNQRYTSQASTSFSTATDSKERKEPEVTLPNVHPDNRRSVACRHSKKGISWQLGAIVFINFVLGSTSLLLILMQIAGKSSLLCSCKMNEQASKFFVFLRIE